MGFVSWYSSTRTQSNRLRTASPAAGSARSLSQYSSRSSKSKMFCCRLRSAYAWNNCLIPSRYFSTRDRMP